LLKRLNYCHDASIRRICFVKHREFDEDGNLVFPFTELSDTILCGIQAELLLNSYSGAAKNQIVSLEFEGVEAFSFSQDGAFDYSDVFEVNFRPKPEKAFEFLFLATVNKINFLSVICREIVCQEF